MKRKCGHSVLVPPVPVGVPQHRRDGVGDEDESHEQEDALGVAVGAEQDQGPDDDGGDRHAEIAGHPEEAEGRGDAPELGHHEAEVGDGEGEDGEGSEPERELLADERGQSLAGVDGEPGHHLLDHDIEDRDDDHEEQRPVAELRPGRRVGHDAPGVVPALAAMRPGPAKARYSRKRFGFRARACSFTRSRVRAAMGQLRSCMAAGAPEPRRARSLCWNVPGRSPGWSDLWETRRNLGAGLYSGARRASCLHLLARRSEC